MLSPAADDAGERRYKYYNWRKDTTNDLQVIFLINAALVLGGSLVKWLLVDPLNAPDDAPPPALDDPSRWSHMWADIYECAPAAREAHHLRAQILCVKQPHQSRLPLGRCAPACAAARTQPAAPEPTLPVRGRKTAQKASVRV